MIGLIKKSIKRVLPKWIMIDTINSQISPQDILFTFDDGPHPEYTPQVLDILRTHNKKAIFFVIGQKVEENPELVLRIQKEGHIIGNHTFSHPYDIKTSYSQYREDTAKAQITLKKIFGVEPKLFRPPCGELSFKTILTTKSLGLRMVLMSNGGGEWNNNVTEHPEIVEKQIINNLRKGQIIVMHDNNKKIPAILDSLIIKIESQNLKVCSEINL